jgi:hypothetical protein
VLDCKIIYILLITENTTVCLIWKTGVLWWWHCGLPVLQRNIYNRILLITPNYASMIRLLTWLDATAVMFRRHVHYNNIQSTLVTSGSRFYGHCHEYRNHVKRQVFSTQRFVTSILKYSNIIRAFRTLKLKGKGANILRRLQNKGFQQMQPITYLYVCVTSHPTCFGPLLAHHQGCPGLLVYATIWFMQCCCPSVRPRTVAASTTRPPSADARTDNSTAW